MFGARPSAVATLVDRATRSTMVVALPDGYKADTVAAALIEHMATLPTPMRRSLTWDSHTGSAPGVGPGLTRRGIGFVPCPGFVGLVAAPGCAPSGRTGVT